jgi:diadenosine tetraphosphate (Ap4A) HIT family hydrolase
MTPLEHLWAGWRLSYVSSIPSVPPEEADTRSVFTRILQSGLSDDETFILHRGACCFVILNAFPYATGHAMVLPYREVAALEELTPEETAELWPTVTTLVTVLKAQYRPDGLNVGINLGRPAGGSVSQHLHVHVVPRWTGDANFMTAIGNTRTMPEELPSTAARIRAAWPSTLGA